MGMIPLFTKRDILFRYIAGISLDASIAKGTFERDGGAFQSDSDQLLDHVATDVLRDGHYVLNPNTSLYERTTLLEQQRTNGWTWSEALDNAAWGVIRASKSADATTAPDGASTADKLAEDNTASSTHFLFRNTPSLTDNTDQSLSFFAKAAGRSELRVRTVDKGAVGRDTWFDLSSGGVGTSNAGHDARIVSLDDGWFRCIVEGWTSSSGGTTPSVEIYLGSGSETDSYSGDGTSGIFLWGLQFEADKSFASSYIKTEGSTASRAADNLSFAFNHRPQAMTGYVRFFEMGGFKTSAGGTGGRLVHIGSGDNSTPRLVVDNPNERYRLFHQNAGSSVFSLAASSPSIGDLIEMRLVLFPDGAVQIHQSINGASEVSGSKSDATDLASAWSGAKLWVNSVGSVGQILNAFTHVLFARGERERAFCRARAGGN